MIEYSDDEELDDEDEEFGVCDYCGAESDIEGVFPCSCDEEGLGVDPRCEYCGDEIEGQDHSSCEVNENNVEDEDEDGGDWL